RDIQQQDVGRESACEPDRFVGVDRFADNRQIGLGLEQPPQPVAKDRVVVRDDQPDGGGGAIYDGAASSIGTVTSTRAPKPGRDSTLIVPPTIRARSPIVRGPCRSASSSSCERRPANEKPLPSSSIDSFQRPSSRLARTSTRSAPLCLRMFTSAS